MNEIKDLSAKLHRFAALLNLQQLGALKTDGTDCEANRLNRATSVKIGPKYSRVDIGNSGRYMVVNATGEIFGIKAYGVIHKGHSFGTLDTIQDWDWSQYRAVRLAPQFAPPREIAAKVAAGVSYNDPAPAPAVQLGTEAGKAVVNAILGGRPVNLSKDLCDCLKAVAADIAVPAPALKLGDRVSATIYGALKQGTIECIAQGGIVFVRWDGAKTPTWLHPQSLTKIESEACSPEADPANYTRALASVAPVPVHCISVEEAIRDAITCLNRLPDTEGAYRVAVIKQLETVLPKAREIPIALEKIRVATSANSYQVQYEADNLDGLIKTVFNLADEALKAGVAP